jgi:hypothetical protein
VYRQIARTWPLNIDMSDKRLPLNAEPDAPSSNRDVDVATLQQLGYMQATRLGHLVDPWSPTEEAGVAAWRMTCRRCRALAYIRNEGELLGLAGRLCNSRCPAKQHTQV